MKNLKTIFLTALSAALVISSLTGCATRNNTGTPKTTGNYQGLRLSGRNLTGQNYNTPGVNTTASPALTAPGAMNTPGIINTPGTTAGATARPTPGRVMSSPYSKDGQRAALIRNALRGMNGIDEFAAIVRGNSTIVAVRPKAGTDVAGLKKSITSKVKQIDPKMNKIAVSTSGDILTKVQQLTTNTANNLKNTISSDFNQLIKSITP